MLINRLAQAADVVTGPWRMLVLDPAGDDPHWLIVTVTDSADVRPAVMESGGRRYAGLATDDTVGA